MMADKNTPTKTRYASQYGDMYTSGASVGYILKSNRRGLFAQLVKGLKVGEFVWVPPEIALSQKLYLRKSYTTANQVGITIRASVKGFWSFDRFLQPAVFRGGVYITRIE